MPSVADSGLEIYALPLERYERMVDAGILGPDDHVELLRGVLAAMAPQGNPHAGVIQWLTQRLVRHAPDDIQVRIRLPLRLVGANSEPEPDVAVVAGPEAHFDRHPETALLVIEVAATSTSRDLLVKADVYAQSGIAEYWVVTVRDPAVTVHRKPSTDGYAERTVLRTGVLQAADPRIPSVDLGELLRTSVTADDRAV